jgi:hypothetical protein
MVSDITKAVHDAWRFAIPPLVRLTITAFVFVFLGGQSILTKLWSTLANQTLDLRSSQVQATLDAYGLKALIPIGVLVAIVVVLYTFEQVVFAIAELMPIHYGWGEPPETWTDPRVLELARRNPAIEDLSDVNVVIALTIDKVKAESRTGLLSYFIWAEERSGQAGTRFGFTKFLFVWSLVSFIVITRTGFHGWILARTIVALTVLAVFGLGFACQAMFFQKQAITGRLHVAELVASMESQTRATDEEPRIIRLKEMTEVMTKHAPRGWWTFSISAPNLVKILREYDVSPITSLIARVRKAISGQGRA